MHDVLDVASTCNIAFDGKATPLSMTLGNLGQIWTTLKTRFEISIAHTLPPCSTFLVSFQTPWVLLGTLHLKERIMLGPRRSYDFFSFFPYFTDTILPG